MEYRLGTEKDVAELKKLDTASAEVDAIGGRKFFVLRSRRMIEYFIACHGLLVAETDGRIVGYALTHVVEWMHGVAKMAWVEHVGVHPDSRRRGVALRLVRFAARHYKGRARCLYGEIHPKNARSLGLFRKVRAELVERVLAFRKIR